MPGFRRPFRACLAVSLLTLSLAACHRQGDATTSTAPGVAGDTDAALPKPASAGGPVTGMPSKPGPGPVGPPVATSVEAPEVATVQPDPAQAPVVVEEAMPDANASVAGGAAAISAEPTLEDAVAVVRGYYAALSAHDAARAHAYWAQGSRPAAEPDTEADTVALAADVGAPGRLDAAAGSRYVRVPVTLTRTLRDGGSARSTASLILRRAVVDGATPEQRAWRISAVEAAPAVAP